MLRRRLSSLSRNMRPILPVSATALRHLMIPGCFRSASKHGRYDHGYPIVRIIRSNGVELAYDIFGDDTEEAVVLISGLGAQMIRWTVPFCEALAARGYHIIRFDNRDAGPSTHLVSLTPPAFAALAAALRNGERPDVPYTLDDMAADALGLLDALSIERAHIVGRSKGGMIAQILASEHPERTLSLTSIMSSNGNPALPQATPEVFAMMMRPAPDPAADLVAYLSHRVAFARRIAGSGHAFDEDAQRSTSSGCRPASLRSFKMS